MFDSTNTKKLRKLWLRIEQINGTLEGFERVLKEPEWSQRKALREEKRKLAAEFNKLNKADFERNYRKTKGF